MKCYQVASKHDASNFNVYRDLSYLQLYLRQFESFLETSKKALDVKPNLLVNWATYSFANYLCGEYEVAHKVLFSSQNIGVIKEQEKNEITLFLTRLKIKTKDYQNAFLYLQENKQ